MAAARTAARPALGRRGPAAAGGGAVRQAGGASGPARPQTRHRLVQTKPRRAAAAKVGAPENAAGETASEPVPFTAPLPGPPPAAAGLRRWGRVAVLLAAGLAAHVALPHAAHAAEGGGGMLAQAASWVLHLDKHMSALIAAYGAWTYALLFGIVFCETGLVVTPFLPGDSLLFAVGAFCALGALNVWLATGLLFVAAVLGDAVNYGIGAWMGTRAIESGVIKPEYVAKTEKFYEKYGGKTVVLARFVPIVRTFAPFIAGVGSMRYSKFAWYNVLGGAIWTGLFIGMGYLFGNLPFVQHNFTLVVLAIVAVSVVPIVYEIAAAKGEGGGGEPAAP